MRKYNVFFLLLTIIFGLSLIGCKEPKEVNVTYTFDQEINNDTYEAKSFTCEEEDTIEIIANPYDRAGYIFKGWKNNNSAKLFQPSEEFKLSDTDVHFYATWEVITYKLQYELNGGTNNQANKSTYTVENQVAFLEPTRANYSFLGWYDNASFEGNVVTSLPKGTIGNKTFYARWAEDTYSINYVLDGGINNPDNKVIAALGEEITLLSPTKEGYDFCGWYDNPEFEGDAITTISSDTEETINVYAKWLKIVLISFEDGNDTSLKPLAIHEGDTLEFSQLPIVTDKDFVFDGWYKDPQKTQTLEYGKDTFLTNATLYAKFVEATEDKVNVYRQDNIALIDQSNQISFTVITTIALTESNLYDYVTINAGNDRFIIPELSITPRGVNTYVLSPVTSYTDGGNYEIIVTDQLKIEIIEDEVRKLVQKVFFIISDTEKGDLNYHDYIIEIDKSDYLYYDESTVRIKETSVIDKNIHLGSILRINTGTTSEHYKVNSMARKTVSGGMPYYEVELVEPSLGEVYKNLDIYSNKMENESYTLSDDVSTKEKFIQALERNGDFKIFEGLIIETISEYAKKNKIQQDSRDVKRDYDLDINIYKTSKEGYADVYTAEVKFKANVTVELSDKVKAMISFEFKQQVDCATTVQGYLYADGFYVWDLDVDYDILLYTIIRSETLFTINVTLNNDGDIHSITNDLQDTIDTRDPDSVISKYLQYYNLDTDELEVLNIELCRFSFNIKIFEFGIPIELRVKLDINSIFKGSIDVIIQKGYSISGTDETGLKWSEHDHQQYYLLEFQSIGSIGIKVGISGGIEVSFTGLSILGRIGVEIEVGAYFKYYGYGSRKIFELRISGNDLGTETSGKSNYFYEFGIYLAVNLYARSDIFNLDYTKNLLYKEFPLFDGGNRYVKLGFVNQSDEPIVVNTPDVNLLDTDVFDMKVLDLKTGKVSVSSLDISKLYISGYYGSFDTKTGNFDFLGQRNSKIRYDLTFTIQYYGDHGDWNSANLYKDITITYLPPNLNIDPSLANEVYKVDFLFRDEIIHTAEVKIAYCLSKEERDIALQKAIEKDPLIINITWTATEASIYEPILDDVVFEPKYIAYPQGRAIFNYKIKIGNTAVATYTDTISADINTDTSLLVSQLSRFKGHIDENYYRFIGWDQEFEKLPYSSDYENGRDLVYNAEYELIPFQVKYDIAPIYDVNNKLVRNRIVEYVDTLWGETLNYPSSIYFFGFTQEVKDQDGNVSLYHKAYEPTTLYVTYTIRDSYNIYIYDSNTIDGKVIMQFENYKYGEDASEILNDPKVIALANTFNKTTMEERYEVIETFIGWSGNLSYITWDVHLTPLINVEHVFPQYTVKFDPCGGKIAPAYEYQALNGFVVNRGYDLKANVDLLNPTKAKDYDNEYRFVGWYDNSELVGEPVTDFTASQDIIYYAKYEAVERLFKFTAQAEGSYYVYQGSSIDILAKFPDTTTTIIYDDITRSQLDQYVAYFTNDDDSPKPIPVLDKYEFSYWVICSFEDEVIIYPEYRLATGDIKITFNIGKAVWDDKTGVINETIQIETSTHIEIYVDNFFEPLNEQAYDYYDGELKNFFYAYEDENYYYFPKSPICWSLDGMNPIEEGTSYMLYPDSEDMTFIALYDSMPKMKEAIFEIDRTDSEYFTDMSNDGSKYLLYPYLTVLSEEMIPTVAKKAPEFSVYEYVFEYWLCKETNVPYINDFVADYTYTPVFTKQIRSITLTFDATEKGIFQSTGSRYRYIDTYAGVEISDYGEEPIFTDVNDLIYFNWYFYAWDHLTEKFENDTVITAYYEGIRNQNPAPLTGIEVTNGVITEDIAYNTIPGYTYNPDEKTLEIVKPGLTFTDNDDTYHELTVYVATSEVTFKNINFDNSNNEFRVAYFPRGDEQTPQNEQNPQVITTINIEETVKFKVDINDSEKRLTTIFSESGVVINGIGDNALMQVDVNATEFWDTEIISFNRGHYDERSCELKNITLDINADFSTDAEVYAIFVNAGAININNSKIDILFTGNTTNKYALVIDKRQVTTDILSLQPYITYTGCEWTIA